ncbi:MAG: M48 family metallopeptidase [Polyangia bacterium]|jgi:predicted Zn-dependent protease
MRLLAVLAACSLAGGCATIESGIGGAETTAAEVLIPPSQENALGLQVKNDLEQNQHVKYLADPAVNLYVTNVANKVIAFGRQARPEVTWQVRVIDDPNTVNAFATPGGYLYVYSGLLLAADNEAELAGVMAHETGHVVARHAARNLVTAYGLQAVTSLALGKNPNLGLQIAANLAQQGTLLAHSRADETEADQYGVLYASKAGYDPHGLVTFFQKLQSKEGNLPKVLSYLSDHPATADRIAHVNQLIAQKGLGGGNLNAAQFASIRARLGGSAASSSPTPTPSSSPAFAPQPASSGRHAPPPN